MNKVYSFLIFLALVPILNAQQVLTPEERLKDIIVKGEIIARLETNYDPEIVARNLPEEYGVKVDRILSKPTDIWLFKFDTTQIEEQALARTFYSIEGVVDAQINTLVELRNAPNDPGYASQWQHQNIDSEGAWEITTGGENAHGEDVVVCIIESANVMGHPDLVDNHWVNTEEIPNNGVDDDGNGYIDDYNGWNVSGNNDNIGSGNHGTQVAGMIGAKGNNGMGIAGANWDVKMMVVAGHNPNSQANIVECYTYPLEQRLLYNQTNGAEGAFVVATNASWGLDYQDAANYPIWCNFYDDLGAAGILNCGATTNNNENVDQVGDVPTGCSSEFLVSVTATNQSDIKTFAGYGVNSIDVAAPGDGIFTTNGNDGYGSTQGTSFASPLTAGVIGLLYSIPCPDFMNYVKNNPTEAARIVRDALYDGVDKTTQLESMVATGGRINANNSMEILTTELCGQCIPPLEVDVSSDENSIEVNFTEVESAESYVGLIRPSGDSDWQEFTFTGSSYIFDDLDNCSSYEVAIVSECEEERSNLSDIFEIFTTACGTCIEKEYCSSEASKPITRLSIHPPSSAETIINESELTLASSWGGDVNEGYNYGNLVLVDDGSTNGELGCQNLVNDNDIQGNIAVAVRGDCDFSTKAFRAQNAGATAIVIINNQFQGMTQIPSGNFAANVNIPVVLISQDDGADILAALQNEEEVVGILGSQNEFINEITIGSETHVTGDDGGYRPANEFHHSFIGGQSVNFTLKPGFDGPAIPTYTRIWIDFNENGIFENNELVYDQESPETGNLNGTFELSNSLNSMRTRMRVQMVYQGPDANPLPTPCENFMSGEVEDYCVAITSLEDFEQGVVNIYPNPGKDIITIDTEFIDVSKVYLYDFSGKLVLDKNTNSNKIEINANNFAKGVYNVIIVDKNEEIRHVSKITIL